MLNFKKTVSYHEGAFPPELQYAHFIHELLPAEQALARFDQMLKNLHNSEIILAPLRNQEAVLSSRMEGTISTMDEIMELESLLLVRDGDMEEADKETRRDVIETLLYQRALKNAQKALESGYEISESVIRQIHQRLLSFGRGAHKAPGAYKTEQNYIGDAAGLNISFIPIAPEKLVDGMERLFSYLKNSEHPVLVKTALMHLEFEALHPLQDGNGRIWRMLITLYLWQQGLISAPHFYISGFMEQHKREYVAQMRGVYEKGSWDEWCAFFFTAVKEQAVSNLNAAEQIRTLYEEMKIRNPMSFS